MILAIVLLFLAISVTALVLGIVLGQSSIVSVSTTITVVPTITPIDKTIMLLDTFTQAGTGTIPLSQHTPEIGGPWLPYNPQPELVLVLGEGYCTNVTASVDINQSCVCKYNNLTETLYLTLKFVIPSTITNLGNLAGLASGFVDTNANGYNFQFFYDPQNQNYALQLVQITAGVADYVLSSKFSNTPPPLNQTITLTADLKPSGGFLIQVLDLAVSGQGIYSSIANDLHNFVIAVFRGDPTELINFKLEEVLIRAV